MQQICYVYSVQYGFRCREGTEPGGVVGTGSHIDALPYAGKYDGVLGVLGAIEAIRTLKKYILILPLWLPCHEFLSYEQSTRSYESEKSHRALRSAATSLFTTGHEALGFAEQKL